jgi:hypothetical protein
MRLNLNINLDSADARDPEDNEQINPRAVAGYLRDVAGQIENYATAGNVRDPAYGHKIGEFKITKRTYKIPD